MQGPNTTLNIPAGSGLLANDLNPDGAPLLVSLVDDVSQGTLNLSDDGSFDYTPPSPAFIGDVTFTYKILDLPNDPPDPRIVSVTLSVDMPPLAVDDQYDAVEDEVLSISAALGLLENDSDAELDPLSTVLISQPAHGSVSLNAEGSFTYTPEANFAGPDSFSYRASDGDQTSPLTMASLAPIRSPIGRAIRC